MIELTDGYFTVSQWFLTSLIIIFPLTIAPLSNYSGLALQNLESSSSSVPFLRIEKRAGNCAPPRCHVCCHQSCLNSSVETHCHSLLLHSPSPRFFRSSCLAFPFWCPRQGNSRDVDAAFIILHDSQTYSNTGITFDLNILIRLLFQTPVNLPNTALTLPCLEMMSSSASPSVLTLAPKLDLESLLSLLPLPDKKRSVSSL